MRITTWNVNGLRAAIRKGLSRHLDDLAPDAVMFQEIRALPEQLDPAWGEPQGWHVHWHPAERLGYAGVATLARTPLDQVRTGLDGRRKDVEGRVLRTWVQGVELVNVYLPSGSSSEERQQRKEEWMTHFLPWAAKLARRRHPVVLGGDLNIAHTENDIHNPTGNRKNSGFLPHERAWFGELLATGWTDVVREQFGEVRGPYSWWSNRGRARELDRGWRIDYLLTNRAATKRVRGASISRAGGLEISDHAPVSVDLDD